MCFSIRFDIKTRSLVTTSERNIMKGWENRHPSPLASGTVVETCIACLYSCQKIHETAMKLRIRNRVNVILATGLHW